MERLRLSPLAITAVLVWFGVSSALGQSEKITIRMAPEPNVTVRVTMVQDMEMEMTLEGELPPGMPQSQKMMQKSTSTLVQRTGPLNAEGNTDTEVTIEESRSESTMNGQPSPVAAAAANALVGVKFTVTTDKQGNTIAVKVPPGVGVPVETFTQMMKSAAVSLPTAPMGVGEVVTSSLDLPMPLPVSNGEPARINGQAQYKLVSIEKDATAARIARFEVILSGTLVSDREVPVQNGRIDMNMNLTLTGTGTVLRDLDRGVTRSSETKASYGGKIKMFAAGAPALPTMDIRVTLIQTTTSN